MLNLRKSIAAIALTLCASALPASAAVYVVAHPDDDILLMGPNLVNDIISGYPTVIIIVTAGDAGNGIGATSAYGVQSGQYNNQNNQYYRLRLGGHQNAVDSWVPAGSRTNYKAWTWIDESFSSSIPTVERWFLGNVVEYHLNLPDALDGSKTKLQELLDGNIATLSDIRGLNTYTAASLRETIRQIIARNNHGTPALVINFPEYVANGTDHPDHTSVGRVLNDAITERPAFGCMSQAIYPGYSMASISPNYPNLLDRQRQGYELVHKLLLQGGNITPITGGPVDTVAHPTWAPTTPFGSTTTLQMGTMDSFHTSFYGKSQYRGARPLNQSCAL